jgi:predicted extracellular nuclease
MKGWLKYSRLLILLAVLCCFCTPDSSGVSEGKRFPVVFYNVENLFDAEDDPTVNDNEFLPGSKKAWTAARYSKKLQDLARVLRDSGQGDYPALIGLCEVENRRVAEALAATGALKKGNYAVVHQDSPDSRGIDVALLYRPGAFTVRSYSILQVMLPDKTRASTRDILYVCGDLKGGETLHLFVNHWPSRAGGVEQTMNNRLAAAGVLRSVTDSLFRSDPNVHIIIMGDLNDTPSDRSIFQTLGAGEPDRVSHPGLVNLMFPASRRGEGSYNYQGSFDMLDHMIVSTSLFSSAGLSVENGEGYVFVKDYMTFTNSRGQQVPDRTYAGNRYTGGISDHFPVYFFLKHGESGIR